MNRMSTFLNNITIHTTIFYFFALYFYFIGNTSSSVQDQNLLPSDHDLVDEAEWEKCARWNNVFSVETPAPNLPYSNCGKSSVLCETLYFHLEK